MCTHYLAANYDRAAPRNDPQESVISSRRKTARADRPARAAEIPFVSRPFAGLANETDWVALREIVPAATAPLSLKDRSTVVVTLATALPLAWPGMITLDSRRFLGLQVASRSGDASRDLAYALEQVMSGDPGSAIMPADAAGSGVRLQDLLTQEPLDVTVQDGFDYWTEGVPDEDGQIAASMELANASVVPTVKLTSVVSGYWCQLKARAHLRWVLPEEEDVALDALSRLAVGGGLSLGEESRYVGSFRAHGLLVPVWDLPHGTAAVAYEEPVAALRIRLDEALSESAPLTSEQRRARAGLLSRQLTLR